MTNMKPEDSIIKKEDPWADDAIGRKKCADTLESFVKDKGCSLVISLNGGWGTGKTFFLKRWQAQLEKNGQKAIYFSAWENDYCDEPIIALIGQIWISIKDSDFNEITQSFKENVGGIFRETAFYGLKTVSLGFLDVDDDKLRSIGEHALASYIKSNENIKDLKRRLTELAEKNSENTNLPLVFIIDELDRCRPLFSIALLERIKHIFSIPGIVFVLGIDREQLGHSVKSVYGIDMDVEGYLRRFFDVEFVLPIISIDSFCDFQWERFGISNYLDNSTYVWITNQENTKRMIKQKYNEFFEQFKVLSAIFCLSLREIEHAIRVFLVAHESYQWNLGHRFHLILALFIMIKIKKPEIYRKILNKEINYVAIIDNICDLPKVCNGDRRIGDLINHIEAIIYCIDKNNELIYNELKNRLNKEPIDNLKYLSKRSKICDIEDVKSIIRIIDNMRPNLGHVDSDIINIIASSLELFR